MRNLYLELGQGLACCANLSNILFCIIKSVNTGLTLYQPDLLINFNSVCTVQ
ncbi:hypothetical protein DK880_00188 [Candidatus Cardinium hertigii]|uniref:Uncharacterized protein n=1 Tax=Candidatus Cardinium hertigii TaxID=247481 RepID=A0A2Z3LB99_9BACT|nr:hypothetical protein DK880_00188 [Candidatus Cardinium hertigii]